MRLAPTAWIAALALATGPVNAGTPDQLCAAGWSIAGVSIGSTLAGQAGRDAEVVVKPGSEPDVLTLRATTDPDGVVTTLTANVRSGAESWRSRFGAVSLPLGCEDTVDPHAGSCRDVLFSDCPVHAVLTETTDSSGTRRVLVVRAGPQPYFEKIEANGRVSWRRRG